MLCVRFQNLEVQNVSIHAQELDLILTVVIGCRPRKVERNYRIVSLHPDELVQRTSKRVQETRIARIRYIRGQLQQQARVASIRYRALSNADAEHRRERNGSNPTEAQ